jgi:hypothetical protein
MGGYVNYIRYSSIPARTFKIETNNKDRRNQAVEEKSSRKKSVPQYIIFNNQ